MLKEFKEFAMRGNVVDLAVGVIIGGAFGKIVTSLVNDILMPPLGLLLGNMDFRQLAVTLKPAEGDVKAVTLNYGVFINTVIDFTIVAFCIFLVVKAMNSLKKKEPAPPPAPTETNCPECLMTIPIRAKRCGHCTAVVKALLAVMLLAWSAASAMAQDVSNRLGVSGFGGAGIPLGSRYVKDTGDVGPAIGGLVRYGLTPHWSAGLSYENIDLKKNIRLETIVAQALYSFCAESRWSPYLLAGWGVGSGQGAKNFNDLTLKAGLGMDFFVTDDIALGPTAHYQYISKTGDAQNDASVVTVGAMATYFFGAAAPRAQDTAATLPPPPPAPAAKAPADSDGDGVTDDRDQCPDSPRGSAVDANGCPPAPADTDGDGVADDQDRCPDSPKGSAVNSVGCPQLKPAEKVSIELNVLFETGKADVRPQYQEEIRKVAEFMRNYPETSAEIEGHTDNVGSAAYNTALSQRRADSVRQVLVNQFGIDGGRLTAKGYGPSRPLASNDTSEGREKNRRVVATLSATKQP